MPHDSSPKPAALPAHGGGVDALARALGVAPESILDFSNNADSLAYSLTRAIADAAPHAFDRYPDDNCTALRQDLAAYEDVDPDQILPGNGSSALIHLALAVLRPASVAVMAPTFSEYHRACAGLGIPCHIHRLDPGNGFAPTQRDLDALNALAAEGKADLVVCCSPNNPTGHALDDPGAYLARLRTRYVLLDATYADFLREERPKVHEAHRQPALEERFAEERKTWGGAIPELLALRSFTKYFHCTGIRLGYLLGRAATLERLRACQPPWTVSTFAQEAGRAMLAALPAYRERKALLPPLRADLARRLEAAELFAEVSEGAANFVLCRLREPKDAPRLHEALARQRMLIRVCDNIPGMPPGYVRICARRKEDNERLTRAVQGFARGYV